MGRSGGGANGKGLRGVVGIRLCQERLARGYSLEGMAEFLGVSKSTLSVWERGERAMTLDMLEEVACRLGLEAQQLLRQAE